MSHLSLQSLSSSAGFSPWGEQVDLSKRTKVEPKEDSDEEGYESDSSTSSSDSSGVEILSYHVRKSPQEAAHTIFKNYRLSRSFLDFLWKGAPVIASLPSPKYLEVIARIEGRRLEDTDLRRVRSISKALKRLIHLRSPEKVLVKQVDLAAMDKAATTVQRAWRRSSAGLHILRGFRDEIVALPQEDFRRFCFRIKPLIPVTGLRVRERAIDNICYAIRQDRKEKLMQKRIPVCFNLNQAAGIVDLLEEDITNESLYERIEDGHLYLTKEVARELEKLAKFSLQTKEELNVLIQAVLECDLFCWENLEEACHVRCQLFIDMSRLIGVHEQDMRKVVAFLPPGCRKYCWGYHEAVLFSLANGEEYVADPGLSKEALPLQTWIALQKNDSVAAEEMDTHNLGYFGPLQDIKIEFLYDRKKDCIIFSAHRSLFLRCNSSVSSWALCRESERLHDSHLFLLAENRVNLEKNWLVDDEAVDSDSELP